MRSPRPPTWSKAPRADCRWPWAAGLAGTSRTCGPGVTGLPGSAPAGDNGDDIRERVSRAIRLVRAGQSRTPGHAAWRMRIEGSGSRITLSPSDSPATAQSGGPPLLEAMVGLGSLVERLHTALFAED